MEKKNHIIIETLWSYKLNKKLTNNENTLLIDKVEKIMSEETVAMLRNMQTRINKETETILGDGVLGIEIKYVDAEKPERIFIGIPQEK